MSASSQGQLAYRPLSLDELAAMNLPDLDWVVDTLLPTGSLTLFAGREKSGKSLLAADLAACVACGEPFLDRTVSPGPVILIPAEENLRDIRSRLHKRLLGNTAPPLRVLPVNRSDQDQLDLANAECLEALHTMIAAEEPAVLILDPFREVHRLPENDADAMGPLLAPLRRLAHNTNTAIVLVHHMSRGGTFRGSTAILGSCDQEWAFHRSDELDSTSSELAGTLTVKGRYGQRERVGIRLGDELRWQLSLQALGSPPSARTQVLDFLREATEPATAHEVAAATGTVTKTVQNIIAEEVRRGVAPIVKSGTGAKNDPFRYRATAVS
jgi:hypothetical protein